MLLLAGDEDRAVLAYQERLADQAVAKADWHRKLFAQGSISRQTLNAALSESHAQAIALVQQRGLVASFEHRRCGRGALASVARAKASVREARVNLERAAVKAPFPGRVTRILVAPGELVAPGTTVAEIYDDTRLEIRVAIPNVHLPEVEAALAAGVHPAVLADFGDYEGTGFLERLVGAVEKGRSGVDGLVRLGRRREPTGPRTRGPTAHDDAPGGGSRGVARPGGLRPAPGVHDRGRAARRDRRGARGRDDDGAWAT